MPSADSSADDDSVRRDVELTSEPGAESTSAVRPSGSSKDGGWDQPRSAPPPAPVSAPPRPGSVPITALPAGLPPLPELPAPPPLAAPPHSVAPPAPPPPVGMPSSSALPVRPIPSLDPRPLTAADLEEDFRRPFLSSLAATRSSLAATRPTNTWLSLGMVFVGIAFVVGLLLGRGSGSAHAPASSNVIATEKIADAPARLAVPPAAVATPPMLATSLVDSPRAQVAGDKPAAPVDSTDAADSAKTAAKPQLEPFNSKAAHINLTNAAARAMHCRDATAPAGSVSTVVTFIPSGRVADVTVTTPAYAGTHTGKCIIAKLKGAQVPPFSGEPETLKKTISLK